MKATDNKPNRTEVASFVAQNFAKQNELENATLPDWTENPRILKTIEDPTYREWAKKLNLIWKELARKINSNLVVDIQRHSLIYVNNTFVIPGGRFRGERDCQTAGGASSRVERKCKSAFFVLLEEVCSRP